MSCSTGHLRPLSKATLLAPSNQTQHARVLSALHQVAYVSITESIKEEGHRFYIIDVHTKSDDQWFSFKNGSQANSPLSTQSNQSVRQIKHRFHRFIELRDGLLYHAHAGHQYHARPCDFCRYVVDTLSRTPSLPKYRTLLFDSHETTCRKLEEFLNLALHLTKAAKSRIDRWCEGHEMVPLTVKQLLLGDDGEEDASVPLSQREVYRSVTLSVGR